MLALELFENKEPVLIQALRDFLPIAVKTLKLDHVPKIHLVKALHDTHVPTFGRFENESRKVSVVVDNRNPVDIIRTLAHELVHYAQGERGELDADSWQTGSPEENQAHEQAGIMMREFDSQFPKYLSAEPVMLPEAWTKKYKKSINCSNPKGFSQKAHCAGRKARQAGKHTKSSSVSENFADGKKPGRKGLAKRSGVNCKASVTQLRKVAKNSTGEKARMAHWCANMKSGRSKVSEEQTFDHLRDKKLRRILVSGPKNIDELAWAMEYTQDALSDDYNDEMIPSRVYDARNRAYLQAEAAFTDEDGEFNPNADVDATLTHLRKFWSV